MPSEMAREYRPDPDSFVVVHSQGLRISRRSLVQHQFKPLPRRLGLPNIALWQLRHTPAALALIAGVRRMVVSALLSAAFTLGMHSYHLPKMQGAAPA